MMMMISANDLIALYVGLELQSLALYVVAAFERDSARSAEAGLKYFVLGALSSGMLLYGASLIYGFTGSTQFADIAAAVQPSGANLGLIFGLVFLMAGLRLQDLRRALPYVDAGRLRGRADAGHRLLRRGAQARRHGAHRARADRRLPGGHRRNGSRSWCSSPSPRWRSAPSPRSARPTSSG